MRTRKSAAAGSALFLALAPGGVAGLVPWLLTGWESHDPPVALQVAGVALIAAGAGFLLHAFARFVMEGIGTPAPVAAPDRLVVGGVYRYVRNPMYIAVAATIVGQALLLGQFGLIAHAALFVAVTAAFVRFYEEPELIRRFGTEYTEYRRAVPGWWPRRRPWRPRDHR